MPKDNEARPFCNIILQRKSDSGATLIVGKNLLHNGKGLFENPIQCRS